MKYNAIAPFYDRLMNHVDYRKWYYYICKILKKYCNKKNPFLFEIGGGTGILGLHFINKGFNYIGSDLSNAMAHEAHQKGLSFFCADCRSIPVKKSFDFIFFLYDGINYLLTTSDYNRLFNEIHRILNNDGLFLFDITTQENSLRYFVNYVDYNDFEDYSYVRHSYFKIESALQYNDFTIFKRKNYKYPIFERFFEQHKQKIFATKIIEQTIPLNKFKILGIWDGFSFKNHSKRSERIHFLLKCIN